MVFPPNMGHEDSRIAMAISNLLNMIWNGDEWGISTEDATQQLLEAEELPKESGGPEKSPLRTGNKRRGPGFNKRCESLIWVDIFVRFFSGKGRGKREDWMGFHGAEAKVSSDVKDYSWVFEPDNWRKTENQLKWHILTSLNPMIRSFKNTWSIAEAYEDSAFARQRELVEADTRHVATCGMCN